MKLFRSIMEDAKKTALVTGATGFIGKRLCAYLLENGFKVRALSRQPNYSKQITWHRGDVTEPVSLLGICDDVDVIFHLAGFAHAFDEENPQFAIQHHKTNYEGTVYLLNEAKRAGKNRFIYFSSIKACAESDVCLDENWDALPTCAYGAAKRMAEEAVLALSDDPIILRPTLVYGAGCKGNLAAMIKGIAKGYFPPPPRIDNRKSMIALDDLCKAALLAAFIEKPNQKIFILTDTISYSTFKIYHAIRAALHKKSINIYMPFLFWRLFSTIGDLVEKLSGKRLPINSQAVKKLFGNAEYCSLYCNSVLNFKPQLTLQAVLPEMIDAQGK